MSIKLNIFDNKPVLEIDSVKINLEFTLGAGIELEKKYDTIDDVWKDIKKINNCIDIALAMINTAIKKYNREYNESIKPVDSEWIAEQGLDTFEEINKFKLAVIQTVIKSNEGTEAKSTENNNKKKQS